MSNTACRAGQREEMPLIFLRNRRYFRVRRELERREVRRARLKKARAMGMRAHRSLRLAADAEAISYRAAVRLAR